MTNEFFRIGQLGQFFFKKKVFFFSDTTYSTDYQ